MLNPTETILKPSTGFHIIQLIKKCAQRPPGSQIRQGPSGGPQMPPISLKKIFHLIIFFSLTTFVSKIFQIYYYKNGETPDLLV